MRDVRVKALNAAAIISVALLFWGVTEVLYYVKGHHTEPELPVEEECKPIAFWDTSCDKEEEN